MQNQLKELKDEWEKKGQMFKNDLKAAEKMKQSLHHMQRKHINSISEWLKDCKKDSKKNVSSAADVQSDLISDDSDFSSDKKKKKLSWILCFWRVMMKERRIKRKKEKRRERRQRVSLMMNRGQCWPLIH